VNGQPVDVNPIRAMMSPATVPEVLHMIIAAYAATGLAVAGVHAAMLLRRHESHFHRAALGVALLVGAPAAALQPLSGDICGEYIARWQPAKLAAAEGDFHTQNGAPLRLGGIPDISRQETRYAIEIPYGLSLLAFRDPHARVQGLDAFPADRWPPVTIVHVAFQSMIVLGMYMAVVALWALWHVFRRREPADNRALLWALCIAAPMGFAAIEAGWTVTELGRQPWIIYGIMRTAEAVTPMPGLIVPFLTFTALYCGLGVIVAVLLYRQVVRSA